MTVASTTIKAFQLLHPIDSPEYWKIMGDCEVDKQIAEELPVFKDDRRRQHYDEVQGVDFYKCFLGKQLSYSCNLWYEDTKDNDEATENKYHWYSRLLNLRPNQKGLEIGSGFGNLAKWIRGMHDVDIDSVNVSQEQYKYCIENNNGVRFHNCSWEDYDAHDLDFIISEGVLVHQKDKRAFFEYCYRSLKKGGSALVREMHLAPNVSLDNPLCKGLNATYAFSGSYCGVGQMLDSINLAGFNNINVHYWDIENYKKTQRGWLQAMKDNKEQMKAISFTAWQDRMLNFNLFMDCFNRGFFTMTTYVVTK